MSRFLPCLGDFLVPGLSPAENIVSDFRVNILTPNSKILYENGQSCDILKHKIPEIQDRLAQIVYNIDPYAPSIYKYTTYSIYGGVILYLHYLITMLFIGGKLFSVGIIGFVVLLVSVKIYYCWVNTYCNHWREKVLPFILHYFQKEFKETYSQNVNIHVLYPIPEFRGGIRWKYKVAHWIVIRITNGLLQEPINAPVYWSSNGKIMKEKVPLILEDLEQPQKDEKLQKEEKQLKLSVSDNVRLPSYSNNSYSSDELEQVVIKLED